MAVLLALQAGCGGMGRSGAEPVPANRAVPGAAGRHCLYVSNERRLPTLIELTRPGTGGSIALWGRGSTEADTVMLSVLYGEDGRLEWVQPIESTVPVARLSELLRLLQAAMAEQWREDWGVRLRLVGGDVDAVLPSVVCEAYPVHRVSATASPFLTQSDFLEYLDARGRVFDVMVDLDEDGRVRNVRLQHPTGYQGIDQYLRGIPWDWEFAPRLHDGIPVASTLRLTVRLDRY